MTHRQARNNDDECSKNNRSEEAQRNVASLVKIVMSDGKPRIDDQICAEVMALPGVTYEPSRIRHGRLALLESGFLRFTGRRVPTGRGKATSQEWVLNTNPPTVTNR